MRFSKSSIKTHIMRGATSKQAKSRSVQKLAHPVKRIHFTDVKPLRQFLMISSTILVQKDFKNGLKLRSQPLQSKEIKYLQKLDSKGLPEGYQADPGFLAKLQKQVPLFK
jgi:hypothetical protein